VAARHADHWNTWGGPETLARKSRILDEHCAAVGRDPRAILRSAVMPIVVSNDPADVSKLEQAYMKRMGADPAKARDTVLGGTVEQVKAKLARLQQAGVGMLFVPTMLLPSDRRGTLDRFMAEVAPAFR
jgi:alkanesulfonate monooxygenase SsuD/methylene tetrahydromethanopterin reductase-like flavin-dependent oxidoreductase (luciferase family)